MSNREWKERGGSDYAKVDKRNTFVKKRQEVVVRNSVLIVLLMVLWSTFLSKIFFSGIEVFWKFIMVQSRCQSVNSEKGLHL